MDTGPSVPIKIIPNNACEHELDRSMQMTYFLRNRNIKPYAEGATGSFQWKLNLVSQPELTGNLKKIYD